MKFSQWWSSKVAPLFGIAYLGWSFHDPGDGRYFLRLMVMLVGFLGLGACGYLCNDFFDRTADCHARKANLWNDGQARLWPLAAVSATIPWTLLPRGASAMGWVALELLLLGIYSARPWRLKERGALALWVDALYSYVVPLCLVRSATGGQAPHWWVWLMWACLMGAGQNLVHQLLDEPSDRACGVRTLVVTIGWGSGYLLLSRCLVPLELLLFSLLLSRLPTFFGVFFALRLLILLINRRFRVVGPGGLSFLQLILINQFYSLWMPILSLILLLSCRPSFWPLLLLHYWIFENGPRMAYRYRQVC